MCCAAPGKLPTIPKAVFDFGEVSSGSEVSHEFSVENPTDTPLVVTRVRTSCGCTAGKVEPETIPPHGTGLLRVVFKTGRRTGVQRKHVFVSVKHPDVSLLRCSLEGTLVAGPRAEGTSPLAGDLAFDFGSVPPGQPVRHTFDLRNVAGRELTIRKVGTSTPRLKASLADRRVAANGALKLALNLDTTAKQGPVDAAATLSFAGPDGAKVRCRLFGTVALPAAAADSSVAVRTTAAAPGSQALTISPNTLDFGAHWAGESPTRTLTVTNTSGALVRIRRLSSSCSCLALACANREVPPGSKITIDVQLRLGDTDHAIEQEILIQPEGGDALRVPVTGTARSRIASSASVLYLRNVPAGTTTEKAVTLTSRDGAPFAITACRTPVRGITCTAAAQNEEKTVWRVTCSFEASTPGRRLRGYVTIMTDRPGVRPKIRLAGNVRTP
jgi:hypothetical protein